MPLSDAVLRQYLGGSGLGVKLLLDEGAATSGSARARGSARLRFQSPGRQPADDVGQVRGGQQESADRTHQRLAGEQRLCDRRQALRLRRDRHRRTRAAELSVLVIDDTDVCGSNPRPNIAARRAGRRKPGSKLAWARTIGSRRSGRRASTWFATRRSRTMAAMPAAAAAEPCSAAKNIKAIAVRGTQRAEWAHPERADDDQQEPVEAVVRSGDGEVPRARHRHQSAHVQPVRRAADAQFSERHVRGSCQPLARAVEHDALQNARELRGLHDRLRAHLLAWQASGVRVEYESLFALGSLCGVGDADAVLRASQRCDELGLDTISTGGTIAFAMECVERGWLDEPWLTFGSGDALLRAIELIGSREGIGDLLAEGSRRAAQAIGHDSIAFAPQVKGLEIPGYEPRALQTMALGFAVGARGADHNRSGAYEVDFSDKVDRRHVTLDAVRHAIETEDKAALMDSLIICKFLRGVFDDFYAEAAEMLRSVTGWDVTADELRETARRIVSAKRQFNLLAGWTPAEDTLPERFLNTPLPNDPEASLSRERLDALGGRISPSARLVASSGHCQAGSDSAAR